MRVRGIVEKTHAQTRSSAQRALKRQCESRKKAAAASRVALQMREVYCIGNARPCKAFAFELRSHCTSNASKLPLLYYTCSHFLVVFT